MLTKFKISTPFLAAITLSILVILSCTNTSQKQPKSEIELPELKIFFLGNDVFSINNAQYNLDSFEYYFSIEHIKMMESIYPDTNYVVKLYPMGDVNVGTLQWVAAILRKNKIYKKEMIFFKESEKSEKI